MFGYFRQRRLHGPSQAILLILLMGWTLGPLSLLLQPMLEHFAPGGDVAATRIEAPSQARSICHHHPEGCPKDCFCPKLPAPEKEAAPVVRSGAYQEPSLAHCTGKDAQHIEPALIVLWPQIPAAFSLPPGPQVSLASASSPLPASPCPETPWKVPRT